MPFCWDTLYTWETTTSDTMVAFDFVYNTNFTANNRVRELKAKYAAFEKATAKGANATHRKPTPEEKQRLTDAKNNVSKKNIVLGEILTKISTIYTYDVDTFAIDSKGNLLINLGFAKSLNFDQVTAVLAHEAYHVLQRHHERFREHAPFAHANIATDAFINDDLAKDKFDILSIGGVSPINGVLKLYFLYVEVDSPDPSIAKPQLYKHVTKLKDKNWEVIFKELNDITQNIKKFQPVYIKGDILIDKTTNKSYIVKYVQYNGQYELVEITPEEANYLKNIAPSQRHSAFAPNY